MNNGSLETMNRLIHCITAINRWLGPVLTQYGQEQVELGGLVISQWLAKIASYLTNELVADLFGTGKATPTRIYIYTTLQPWQDALWQTTTQAMGWEVPGTRRLLPEDLFVTNILGSETSDMLNTRAHALVQPVQYPSSAWDGPLGGALDGLAKIAMQPDALVVDTPPLLAQARDETLAGTRLPTLAQGRHVTLLWDTRTGVGQVLDQWMQGRPVLITDPNTTSPDRLTQILATEDAGGRPVTYQRWKITTRRGLTQR